MRSIIFERIAAFIFPVVLILSLFVMIRGHNAPGGGFIGGLVGAAAFVLHALAFGADQTQRLYRLHPLVLSGIGLFFAAAGAFVSVLLGKAFFTGVWASGAFALIGTPLLFDIGVYLVVVGVTLAIIMNLLRSE